MVIDWLENHWIELVGTLFSLFYLYLSVRENIWLWITGLVSALFYIVVFYSEQLYADMGLQGYYVVISIYGWIVWKTGRKNSGRSKMPVTRTKLKLVLKLIGVFVLVYFLIAAVLLKLPVLIDIPRSSLPFWDAFTTSASIVATWMLARKKIEHWLLWVVVDTVSAGMYVYKGLYITALLFVVYTVVAVVGYLEWMKQMQKRDQEAPTLE